MRKRRDHLVLIVFIVQPQPPLKPTGIKSLIMESQSQSQSQSQDWGSLEDSDMNQALAQYQARKSQILRHNQKQGQNQNLPTNTQSSTQSQDWGSMTDNEFISFVNQLSQNENKTSNDDEKVEPTSANHLLNSLDGTNRSLIHQLEATQEDDDKDNENPFADTSKSQETPADQQLEFGDYETYFRNKRLGQQEQDRIYVDFDKQVNNVEYPPLFKDCIIYVNGKTNPDISQLHKMIILHAGKFLHYLGSKGNATHIIADNLTPRKKIEFRNYKVVKPDWIVQSVKKGKLLHWSEFTLIQNDYGQVKLTFNKLKQHETEPQHKMFETLDNKGDKLDDISQLSIVNEPGDGLRATQEEELETSAGQQMDAKHPDFLKAFFSKSRLHHLSTWKTDLRSEFLSRAIETLRVRKASRPTPRILPKPIPKIIIHADFDCFFATVSALKQSPPIDINKVPVCVTNGGASSDVASCNYVARSKGCTNGMWLGQALKKCPDLVCLKYYFGDYERISNIFYDVLLSYDLDSILPVSIDEALIDVSSSCGPEGTIDSSSLMKEIKAKVWELTNCSVSCGCGPNVLLAKLALRQAKPNGIYKVEDSGPTEVFDFLKDVNFRSLPGIGPQIYSKIEKELNGPSFISLGTIRSKFSLDRLISLFGQKTGHTIFNYCRGVDDTSINILDNPDAHTRKSVSIDVNWGIRFDEPLEVELFLSRMAKELNARLIKSKCVGSSIVLKLALRHPEAPIEPAKHLGMGHCEFVSKSSRLGVNTRESGLLSTELKYLWRMLGVNTKDLRGVSVTMNNLVSEETQTKEDLNQMRLPFKKLGVSANKKVSIDNNIPNLKTSNISPVKKSIDRKIFEEAPIIKQLRLSPKKVSSSSSTTTTAVSSVKHERSTTPITSIPARDEIEWEVFYQLPKEIQEELGRELVRRKIVASPSKLKPSSKHDIQNLVESPSKRQQKHKIREGSITKTMTWDFINDQSRLNFQGIPITKFSDILKRLENWLDFSIVDPDGPDETDVILFNDLLMNLSDISETSKIFQIIKRFDCRLLTRKTMPGYDKWIMILYGLKEIYCSMDIEKFKNGF